MKDGADNWLYKVIICQKLGEEFADIWVSKERLKRVLNQLQRCRLWYLKNAEQNLED